MGAENLGQSEAGKRNVKRSRVLLTAKLHSSSGEIAAKLRDLSRKGALLETKTEFEVGDEVTFVRGETVAPARVVWAVGDRVGIEFRKPIRESEVLIHVSRAPAARSNASFRRPRFYESLSAYDRKLAKVVGASLGVSLIDD